MRTNVLVRDLDLGVLNHLDGRRIEVIADGLPLFGGVQLAVDTTLVSVLRGDSMPRRGANQHAGVALREARARKERTYPELAREGGRARLVVLWRSGEQVVVGDSRLPLRSGQRPGRRHFCCKAKRAVRGCADGAESWRALQQRHSVRRCSTLVSQQVRMKTRPHRSKCCATAATTFEWQREGLVH